MTEIHINPEPDRHFWQKRYQVTGNTLDDSAITALPSLFITRFIKATAYCSSIPEDRARIPDLAFVSILAHPVSAG